MLKTVKKMVEHARQGTGIPFRTGNYGFRSMLGRWFFTYFETTICLVDTKTDTVSYSDGGWRTPSTTRVINSFREAFTGYREVTRQQHQQCWDKREDIGS